MNRWKITIKSKFFSCAMTAFLILGTSQSAFATETPKEESAETISAEVVPNETTVPQNNDTEVTHTSYYNGTITSNSWEDWPQGPAIEAQAAILMDYDSGAVLYSKESDTTLYPASITKIMTALLACERDSMDDVVPTTEDAFYNISDDSSKTYLSIGEEFTMEQMLMAIMLSSANDAAYAVADYTSGSMKKFVEAMNWRAKIIGCTNTHFNNPHGLHSENHYTTAHDMALIMRTAWQNPLFRSFASTITYEVPPTNKFDETRYYLNDHKMMKTESREYEGVLGGKTGYTDQAGNTLVTVAQKGSMTLIAVVLNGINGAYDDTASLLDYGFENFKTASITNIVSNKSLVTLPCNQYLFKDKTWPALLQPVSAAYITVPKDVTYQQLTYTYELLENSLCRGRILTNCYYNNIFVGDCTSYEKEVLPDLLQHIHT